MPRRLFSLVALVLVIGAAVSACGRYAAESTAAAQAQAPIVAVDHAAGEQTEPVEVSVAGKDGVGVTFREITPLRVAARASTATTVSSSPWSRRVP